MTIRKRVSASDFIKGRGSTAEIAKRAARAQKRAVNMKPPIPIPARTAKPTSKGSKPPVTPKSKEPAQKFNSKDYVSFERLFRNAAVTDSKYVKDVTVTSLKRFPKATGVVGYESKTVTIDEKKQARKYNHYVIALDGKLPITQSKAIKISCQCARFLYYYEYPLWKRNAADIIYGNGQPALTTNPSSIASCCKHVLSVLYRLIQISK